MSIREPQDDPAGPVVEPSPYKTASYSDAPTFGWEISSNRLQRGLTYVGLYSMRDLTIAVVAAVVTLVVTLGIQGATGVFDDKPAKATAASDDPFVDFGDPDSLPPLVSGDPLPFCPVDDPCGPMRPYFVQVDVLVGPEASKKIPADMRNNPFCRGELAIGETCDMNEHQRVLTKLLDQRQLDYLSNELGVTVDNSNWTFIEVASNFFTTEANPGDITGSQFNGGPFPELVEIYLK